FSGQPKYVPTIEKFLKDNTYERYAGEALKDLPRYQKWNPIIANRSTFDPTYSDDANRVMNMLRSDDILLQRVGAKRIFHGVREDYLLQYLAQLVEADQLKTNAAD